MKALILTDLQLATFQMPQPLFKPEEFLDKAEEMIRIAREKNVPLIYMQHSRKNTNFEKGSPTWAFHPRLAPSKDDIVIHKTEPDAFKGTDLESVLDRLGAKEVYIGGLVTEICVESTVRGAYTRGYKVYLFEDGHTTTGSTYMDSAHTIKYHNFQMKRFADLIRVSDADRYFSSLKGGALNPSK